MKLGEFTEAFGPEEPLTWTVQAVSLQAEAIEQGYRLAALVRCLWCLPSLCASALLAEKPGNSQFPHSGGFQIPQFPGFSICSGPEVLELQMVEAYGNTKWALWPRSRPKKLSPWGRASPYPSVVL